MVVKLQQADGVKVYNITADKVLPAWIKKKKGTQLSKDPEYANHVELIQDLGLPSTCHKVKVTQDQQYVFACGVHAPRIRVYDVHDMALKFERHFDAEIMNFQV
jgi:ribosome biogenesis protein ENP2